MSTPEPLRVGYVLKRYPRFSETFIVSEILAHERAGVAIDIFALGPVEETHFQDIIARVRAPVHRLPYRPQNVETLWRQITEAGECLPGFWPAMRDCRDIDSAALLQAIRLAIEARARGISHLHAHFATSATTVARTAAAFAGLPFSFTAHAKDIYYEYDTPQYLDRKLRDAAFAITVSDFNLSTLRSAHGDAAHRLRRLYNGVDLAQLRFAAPPAAGSTILAVGRLVDKKGFAVLIDAARRLRDRRIAFDCRILGDGPEREPLQAHIDAEGLGRHVRMLGPQPQGAVIAAMREATVLAAPCIVSADGNRDGLPTVLIEAMALGTPVVSTAVTGIPELVRNDVTGLCVAPGDAETLAGALERLLADTGLRQRLAQAARQAIERDFDIDANMRCMREWFAAAAAPRQGGR